MEEYVLYGLAKLEGYPPHAAVLSEISLGKVTTKVVIPGSDLVAVGLFTQVLTLDIVIRATRYIAY